MKVLHINSMISGSTGKIAKLLISGLPESRICYPPFDGIDPGYDKGILIGSYADTLVHHVLGRITGYSESYSGRSTKKLAGTIEAFDPDIIHLHNLHNCYLNIEILFEYLKRLNKPVVWTFHDCWPYTGQCAYYDLSGCTKWKDGSCGNCPSLHRYPKSYRDRTSYKYEQKKRLFTGLENLHIVTPSKWLKEEAEKSFFAGYPVRVINNGIDLDVFHPTKSTFKDDHGLNGYKILLAVSYRWDERKGVNVLAGLSQKLPDTCRLVVVGKITAEYKDKFSQNTLFMERTDTPEELAGYYSAADVFINPTFEDISSMVNMESIVCGTPVICFDSGGSCEMIDDGCGIVIKEKNADSILNALDGIGPKETYAEACVKRAQKFSYELMVKSYMDLYNELL